MNTIRLTAMILALAAAATALTPQPQNEVDDAVARLYSAVRAHDDPATYKALAAVVAFGESAVPRLLAAIETRTPDETVWCLRCLKEIRTPAAKDASLHLCGHPQAAVRAEAAVTAAALAGEAALPLLIKLSCDDDGVVRRRAYDGILQCGSASPELVPVAARGVLDADMWIVLDAVQVLDRISAPRDGGPDRVLAAIDALATRLDEHNAAATLDLAVRRGGIQAGPILLKALDSRRPEVTVQAMEEAGRLRLVSAVQRVSKLAKGSDRRVAKAAVECLSIINDPPSLLFLVDLLDASRDAEMIDAIAVALRRMTGLLLGVDVPAWRKYLADRPPVGSSK